MISSNTVNLIFQHQTIIIFDCYKVEDSPARAEEEEEEEDARFPSLREWLEGREGLYRERRHQVQGWCRSRCRTWCCRCSRCAGRRGWPT